MSPAQWLHDLIFEDYAKGATYPNWSSGSTYYYGNRIIDWDGGVYECIVGGGFGLVSTEHPSMDTVNWIKRQDSFIGARERLGYNFQKLMLEYALNRNYQVASFSVTEWEVKWVAGAPVVQTAPPYTQIYITIANNSQSNFWLSNGAGLNSYMANNSSYQRFFLGNTYNAYSSINFTIHVPSAVYAAIGSAQPAGSSADQAIRSFVDQFAQAGSVYNIVTY